MEELAKELLEKIQKDFNQEYMNSKKISSLIEKVKNGVADYNEANEFATEVGDILARSFKNNITSDLLPDKTLYKEIAEKILNPTLKNNYNLITNVTNRVQETLNKAAGIGLKPNVSKLNQGRIDGIVKKISSDEFDKVAWVLNEPIKTFCIYIVDDTVKNNVESQGKAGLKPVIIRKSSGKCCDWCKSLVGVYYYPDVPQDIYRRHNNCRCKVTYHPRKGMAQDVHSKEWHKETLGEKIKLITK